MPNIRDLASELSSGSPMVFRGSYADPAFRPQEDMPQITYEALRGLAEYLMNSVTQPIQNTMDQARAGYYGVSANTLQDMAYDPSAPLGATAMSVGAGWKGRATGPNELGQINAWHGSPLGKSYDEALYAHDYISPRSAKRALTESERQVRNLSYGVKSLEPNAIESVAEDISKIIPGNKSEAVLIPIPGHTGETTSNLTLANVIANKTGARVYDVLGRKGGPSQRDARVAGKRTMKPEEFGMTLKAVLPPNLENVYFVDNVTSSGATIRAARDMIGSGKGLVYAKANPKGMKYIILAPMAYPLLEMILDERNND